jgi:hypothetical protein
MFGKEFNSPMRRISRSPSEALPAQAVVQKDSQHTYITQVVT